MDKDTSTRTFRSCCEITLLMGYEITRNPGDHEACETPLVTVDSPVIAGKLAIVPVLRAGIGMSEVVGPDSVGAGGHIGVSRGGSPAG